VDAYKSILSFPSGNIAGNNNNYNKFSGILSNLKVNHNVAQRGSTGSSLGILICGSPNSAASNFSEKSSLLSSIPLC
jgi:hypothetical protein